MGTMNYSCNIRAYTLYSEILSAFLESNDSNHFTNNNGSIHDETLRRAIIQLFQNNSYLHPFTDILTLPNRYCQILNNPFLSATHILIDTNTPPVNSHDIIVLNYDFSDEVHNEDFHYTRLIVRFIQENKTLHISISTYDLNLESLLFLDLFTNGKGHFHDILNQSASSNDEIREETYGKYIKQHLMNYDLRWRLHHHWSYWSYL